MTRLLAAAGLTAALPDELAPGVEVLDGTPTAKALDLHTLAGVELGLWEMTAGRVVDVEGDEVFVVLAGAGELRVADEVIRLQPGAVVRLYAGDRTEWSVTETVRKFYVAGD
ncbi:cupin domain-containing protein [Jatrophihabitans sp.]|uniref:cupin domain-containing protein n=1 Tax=Jatrophihabitans sp. TaxID=1932789 RepID=UPI0030C70656|nr:cupin [Jatrophihabitans sp.]